MSEKQNHILKTAIETLSYLQEILTENFSCDSDITDFSQSIETLTKSLEIKSSKIVEANMILGDESDKWAECDDCYCKKCKHRTKCPASDCYKGIKKGANVCKECSLIEFYYLPHADDCDLYEKREEAQ